jgi:hypothetical protein
MWAMAISDANLDPQLEVLRRYFTTLTTAIDTFAGQLQILHATLSAKIPDFAKEYETQTEVQRLRRAGEPSEQGLYAPTQEDEVIQAIQKLIEKKLLTGLRDQT